MISEFIAAALNELHRCATLGGVDDRLLQHRRFRVNSHNFIHMERKGRGQKARPASEIENTMRTT